MKKNEPIRNIMTAQVTSVQRGQKPSEVRKLFEKEGFHHVPVLDGESLVGMISTSDMLRISYDALGADTREMDQFLDHNFSLDQIMATDVVTLKDGDTVRDAAAALGRGQFHSVPVVDRDKRLMGIVTSTDLINYLADNI